MISARSHLLLSLAVISSGLGLTALRLGLDGVNYNISLQYFHPVTDKFHQSCTHFWHKLLFSKTHQNNEKLPFI